MEVGTVVAYCVAVVFVNHVHCTQGVGGDGGG